MSKKSIDECSTPRELRDLIKLALKSPEKSTSEDLAGIHRIALTKIDDFFGKYSELPDAPTPGTDTTANLSEIIKWCRKAEKVIEALPQKMDKAVLDALIQSFHGLNSLISDKLPTVDKAKWKKATEQAGISRQTPVHKAVENESLGSVKE